MYLKRLCDSNFSFIQLVYYSLLSFFFLIFPCSVPRRLSKYEKNRQIDAFLPADVVEGAFLFLLSSLRDKDVIGTFYLNKGSIDVVLTRLPVTDIKDGAVEAVMSVQEI